MATLRLKSNTDTNAETKAPVPTKKNTRPKSRRQHFAKWWSKNHHRTNAHHWLVKNARRVAHAMNVGPTVFEDVQYITKRFNESEYKRLKQSDAWTLWKVCHPTPARRIQELVETAEYYDEQIQTLKQLKAEAKGYYRAPHRPIKIEVQSK